MLLCAPLLTSGNSNMEKDVKKEMITVKTSLLLNVSSEQISNSHCREGSDNEVAEVSGSSAESASCGFAFKEDAISN